MKNNSKFKLLTSEGEVDIEALNSASVAELKGWIENRLLESTSEAGPYDFDLTDNPQRLVIELATEFGREAGSKIEKALLEILDEIQENRNSGWNLNEESKFFISIATGAIFENPNEPEHKSTCEKILKNLATCKKTTSESTSLIAGNSLILMGSVQPPSFWDKFHNSTRELDHVRSAAIALAGTNMTSFESMIKWLISNNPPTTALEMVLVPILVSELKGFEAVQKTMSSLRNYQGQFNPDIFNLFKNTINDLVGANKAQEKTPIEEKRQANLPSPLRIHGHSPFSAVLMAAPTQP